MSALAAALSPDRAEAQPAGAPLPVHLAAGNKAGDRTEINVAGVNVALRWCPPGKFMMGSPESEAERGKDETVHEVTLTQGFWMTETEITQALWNKLAANTRPKFKGSDQPAEPVTWYDAVDFCNKLSTASGLAPAYAINKDAKDPANTGDEKGDPLKWQVTTVPSSNGFRLPTEAQWEYACRAGTTTAFSWGNNTINPSLANYNGGNVYNGGEKGAYLEKTMPVGSYAPNPWGFLDMHGNIWEWCWDWHGPYGQGNATDPTGPASGSSRIIRGGVWHYKPAYVRCAHRYKNKPAVIWDLLGMRAIVPPSTATTKPETPPAHKP